MEEIELFSKNTALDISSVGEVERSAVESLPIIDISSFVNGSSLAERKAVSQQLRKACVDIGFFYLAGHGFSELDLTSILGRCEEFFKLQMHEKMLVLANPNSANLGFIQTGGIDPSQSSQLRPDLKERLFVSRELAPGELPDEKSPAGKSQWPSDEILPGFEKTAKYYTAKMVDLARVLARVFSLSLDLPEQALERFHDRMGCNYAFNYYPPARSSKNENWGFTPHTDYGSFTILTQDDSGGLQARNSAGVWIEVPPIKGTFVVNVGDLLARWTNDIYISTLHRVINRSSDARFSISFFAIPNPRAEIAVLESCQSEQRPSRYAPVIAGEYCAELLAQAHRTGRAGISSRTVERLNGTDQ